MSGTMSGGRGSDAAMMLGSALQFPTCIGAIASCPCAHSANPRWPADAKSSSNPGMMTRYRRAPVPCALPNDTCWSPAGLSAMQCTSGL
jgi:hypothetical protein